MVEISSSAIQKLLGFTSRPDGSSGASDRYAGKDKVSVPLLGGLVIDFEEVFSE